jgi:hypothetical protein
MRSSLAKNMCYVLYASSGKPLPVIPGPDWDAIRSNWPDGAPTLVAEPIRAEDEAVLHHLPGPNKIYIGSFEGCGCGFNRAVLDDEEQDTDEMEGKELILAVQSRQRLRDYIIQNNVDTLYGCWSGDESLPVERSIEITPETIIDRAFAFPERCLMKITKC